MIIVNIHNYKGGGMIKTIERYTTPEKYLVALETTGFDGCLSNMLEILYSGRTVKLEDFSISFSYRPDK
tara:strand:- start:15443 stop:15649 length:207 start_codon:yes stop_codon:yes gene_type:complete